MLYNQQKKVSTFPPLLQKVNYIVSFAPYFMCRKKSSLHMGIFFRNIESK